MNTPALAQQAVDWDDRAFRWNLRDSGILARLRPAETKVLWAMYAHANRKGLVSASVRTLARETGLTSRAVIRARNTLGSEYRLFDLVLAVDQPTGRLHRLIVPPPRRLVYDTPPPRRPPEPRFTPPLNHGSGPPERRFSQSICLPAAEENSSSKGSARRPDQDARPPGPPPVVQRVMFEPGEGLPYVAAAADLLRELGFPAKVAHGLVVQHRPTVEQLENILANIEARDADAAAGRGAPIVNRLGFIRAAVRDGNYALDERVQRRREAQDAERRREALRVQAERAKAREAEEEARAVELRRQAEALYAAMPLEELEARRAAVLAGIPVVANSPMQPHTWPVTHKLIRRWTVEQIVDELTHSRRRGGQAP